MRKERGVITQPLTFSVSLWKLGNYPTSCPPFM